MTEQKLHYRTTYIAKEKRKRQRMGLILVLLIEGLLLIFVLSIFYRYIRRQVHLPELVPILEDINYPPHYLFSIYDVNMPVGVAVSEKGDRIYVSESGGERLIKLFDREGNLISTFAPPRTKPAERSPVYLTLDSSDRLLVTDRSQHAIFIYDKSGQYLDTILSPNLSLSEYLTQHVEGFSSDTKFTFNLFRAEVTYQESGKVERILPVPLKVFWSPLGIRVSSSGDVLVTKIDEDNTSVLIFSEGNSQDLPGMDFNPQIMSFGSSGQDDGQFLFPNSAVVDSKGRIYVSDSNNGRLSIWDKDGNFLFNIGRGSSEISLSLPRGAVIDTNERLYIVDAVSHDVKVFDVSGLEPSFLFSFGEWGMEDGMFNYPNDIAIDNTGRLYIADRENHCIQVWSY